MRKRLLVSVATAALFTTGFAFAQGMNQGGAKGEAPASTAALQEAEAGGAARSSMSREPSGSQAKESTRPRPGLSAEDGDAPREAACTASGAGQRKHARRVLPQIQEVGPDHGGARVAAKSCHSGPE